MIDHINFLKIKTAGALLSTCIVDVNSMAFTLSAACSLPAGSTLSAISLSIFTSVDKANQD
jgi:hypothetical protein